MRGGLPSHESQWYGEARRLRGRRRAWEDRANSVTGATNLRAETGGCVSSLPCAPGEATTHLEGAAERWAGPTTLGGKEGVDSRKQCYQLPSLASVES
jgi:hypothetical protein